MQNVDIFYQCDGVTSIEHIEIEHGSTFSDLKDLIAKKHNLKGALLLFLEDGDDPVNEAEIICGQKNPAGIKAHVHRCRRIEVTVTYNGESVEAAFPPSTTIARLKKWAAEKKFGMTEEEASEHVLQIAGTHDRPAPNIHIGTLTDCKKCKIEFDLVPDERING